MSANIQPYNYTFSDVFRVQLLSNYFTVSNKKTLNVTKWWSTENRITKPFAALCETLQNACGMSTNQKVRGSSPLQRATEKPLNEAISAMWAVFLFASENRPCPTFVQLSKKTGFAKSSGRLLLVYGKSLFFVWLSPFFRLLERKPPKNSTKHRARRMTP